MADPDATVGAPRDSAFDTTTEFRRDLGVVSAVSVVLGTVIGSGIFIAPSLVLKQVGTPGLSLLVWLVTGVCALFGVLCYAELAAMMPRAGGAFVYLRHAFPPWVAFLFGWTSFFVMQPSALALISDVFVAHLDHLIAVDVAFAPATRTTIQMGVIVWLAAANYRGVRFGGWIQNGFTFLKIAGLAAIIAVGLAAFGPVTSGASPAPVPLVPVGPAALAIAFAAAMIASMQSHYGWENVTFIAEEIENPRRNLPLALVSGMAAVMVIYLLVNLALFAALPVAEMAATDSPAALAMERRLGAAGGNLLALVVVVSAFGTLNGAMLASPRLFYAMGKARLFFQFTTRVHPQFRTPHLSIVALTVVSLAYVLLLGSWERITEAVSVAFAAFLSLGVIALFVLRRKYPDAHRPYRVTGYPFTPLVYLAIISAYTVTIVVTSYERTLVGVAIAGAGLIFYPLVKRVAARDAPAD